MARRLPPLPGPVASIALSSFLLCRASSGAVSLSRSPAPLSLSLSLSLSIGRAMSKGFPPCLSLSLSHTSP